MAGQRNAENDRRSLRIRLGRIVLHACAAPVNAGVLRRMVVAAWVCLLIAASLGSDVPVMANDGSGGGLLSTLTSRERREAIAALPLQRLTPQASQKIQRITDKPTIYRRLPTQAIACDRDMFLFLTRNPEVLVGMWDLMDITKVAVRRTGAYQLEAQDGSGTTCTIDLVYGDSTTHVFVATGLYDGKLTTSPVRGEGVFMLRSSYAKNSSGGTTVTGTLDCFIKFDGFGTDLIARTFSGLIGKSADVNFMETSRFVAQVSQASAVNPGGMVDVARRLPQVEMETKKRFAGTILTVAKRAELAKAGERNGQPRVSPDSSRTAQHSGRGDKR